MPDIAGHVYCNICLIIGVYLYVIYGDAVYKTINKLTKGPKGADERLIQNHNTLTELYSKTNCVTELIHPELGSFPLN